MWCQTIISFNAISLLIIIIGTNSRQISIKMQPYSSKKNDLKMFVGWWPFCLGLDVLIGLHLCFILKDSFEGVDFRITLNIHHFIYWCISYISMFAIKHFSFLIVFNLRIMVCDTYISRHVLILYFCILLSFIALIYMNFCNYQPWRNKDIQSVNVWYMLLWCE